jgi:hypothetical protein
LSSSLIRLEPDLPLEKLEAYGIAANLSRVNNKRYGKNNDLLAIAGAQDNPNPVFPARAPLS